MKLTVPLVLASQSPRRRRLLEQMGLTFDVVVPSIEENVPPGVAPAFLVQELAREKAATVAAGRKDALTIGADTVVTLDDEILGKPEDAAAAHAMLRRLSGRTHTVYTGLALLQPARKREVIAYEATEVTFGVLDDDEIEAYVAGGSPMDKAGAYGIQDDVGALFVSRIDGDYYNVVGLPLHRLYQILKMSFEDVLDPTAPL